jgi:hypothetical protein
LRKACFEFGLTIDIDALISEIDFDNNGFIDFDEFTALISMSFKQQQPKANLPQIETTKQTEIVKSPPKMNVTALRKMQSFHFKKNASSSDLLTVLRLYSSTRDLKSLVNPIKHEQ